MATLKAVNPKTLDNNIIKLDTYFKELKSVLKKELINNNGNLSYDRIVEYDDLFKKLKKATVMNKCFLKMDGHVTLEGFELKTFCEKLKIDPDVFYKYQVIIERIEEFNLNKYIKTIKAELQ